MNEMREARYLHIISQMNSSALLDAAHLSPFLVKDKWHTVVANLDPGNLSQWTSAPRPDKRVLVGLTDVVFEYYNEIIGEMGNSDCWTTVLCQYCQIVSK